jgi:hypothetical protein
MTPFNCSLAAIDLFEGRREPLPDPRRLQRSRALAQVHARQPLPLHSFARATTLDHADRVCESVSRDADESDWVLP